MKTLSLFPFWRAPAIALCVVLGTGATHADDSDPGRAQFLKSCGTCHAVEAGAEARQGPNLGTAFGRTAGTLADFAQYSEALKKAGAGGLVWNEETLDKWIAGASDYIPGVNMPYAQPDAAKRQLVITYLKSLGAQPAK